jgi:short subunit dehydrogenase-like uncharacterized protein
MSPPFDVVLFGPTGVTGREVARYLGRRAPELGLSWAVAGRDTERVEQTLRSVGAEPDGVLRADTSDPGTITELAAAGQVLINLVGPYSEHGEVVYEACIDQGTTELDLTGEMDWLVEMLSRHEVAAAGAGARIIPVCGFEALPFDLAARYAAEAAFGRFGEPVVTVDVAVTTTSRAPVRRPADAISGGTWASALGMLRRGGVPTRSGSRLLDPSSSTAEPRPYRMLPRRHEGTGAWLAPLVPSPVLNPPVVHRSAALFRADGDQVFDRDFEYLEGMVVPGPFGPLLAGTLAGAQFGFNGVSRTPPPVRAATVAFLARMGPRPGQGPREQDLDRWRYRLDIRATTTSGASVDAVAEALGHPGYKSTATMVAEAGLILADPASHVPARGGFLTPATALGTTHLDRFAQAGLTFEVR